ncbi:predicted protein [Uncinocarpus reesii 1704]|uniref:Uncharacterized protein n=1 Tax=Uncinocarpus reesii (strain UAMH 1704) TaxID=336963 RepID=C4JNS2_UNCRE|nr:uncharacterized protein UREG_04392 [Uncinocarpus reesii 1704]EEP79546.1 predicted protein [Uncinocarpus reesii 1704]
MSLPRAKSEPPAPKSYPHRTRTVTDLAGYIEQARFALERQRISFEFERAAFSEERKLWEKERSIMQQRIAELERKDNGTVPAVPGGRTEIPVGTDVGEQHHVWEGSSPTVKPSRVFPEDIPHARSELGNPGFSPSLDEALSPKSRPHDRSGAVGVPVELVDSSLDGITLKSTAIAPDIAAKVSPTIPSAPIPLCQPVGTELKPHLPSEQACLASPLGGIHSDMDATPLAPLDQPLEPGFPFSIAESIPPESPRAPLPSLFPVASLDTAAYHKELDEDPALQGPLSLQNDLNQDTEFLEELDEKLLREAHRALSRPSLSSDEDDEGEGSGEPPEAEPEIRFKQSTNLGTAFGSTQLES